MYSDDDVLWMPMNLPSTIAFDPAKFIGVNTSIYGLSTNGAPYRRGSGASDTWELLPGSSTIYSYMFGGGNLCDTVYLATKSTSYPIFCTSYNMTRSPNWKPLSTEGFTNATPPLYVSQAPGGPMDSPNVFAVSTISGNMGTYYADGMLRSVNWLQETVTPTANFQVIQCGGSAPNFSIGYSTSTGDYWVLVPGSPDAPPPPPQGEEVVEVEISISKTKKKSKKKKEPKRRGRGGKGNGRRGKRR